ncbi:MAG: hypothetical protein HZA54_03215 [Planctomycetes bacterium]|nr:hypothetical protein [Planctomycetota bacterium]
MLEPDRILRALLRATQLGAEAALSERAWATTSFKEAQSTVNLHAEMSRRIVTSGDTAVQEIILQHLLSADLRGCRVLAEEDTSSVREFRPAPGAPTIFIDPIDGTLTYAAGSLTWEDTAIGAGYAPAVVERVKALTDRRLFGMVLGATLPGGGLLSVCALPELGIVYHAADGKAFKNGAPYRHDRPPRPTRVVVGPRLLDSSGSRAQPFNEAKIETRLSGSHPGALWRIFEEDCTAFAAISSAFDAQFASVVGRAAGLLVVDRQGRDFSPTDLIRRTDSIVMASAPDERDRLCTVLRRYA